MFWRYIANRVADFWISWAAGYPFDDSQSGFRVYPASLVSRVKIKHGKARSFVFESEILIEATRLGYRSLAVPIEALRRPGARPSYFRSVLDIARITCMVGWKLISRGMYPIGLYRSLFGQASYPSAGDGVRGDARRIIVVRATKHEQIIVERRPTPHREDFFGKASRAEWLCNRLARGKVDGTDLLPAQGAQEDIPRRW